MMSVALVEMEEYHAQNPSRVEQFDKFKAKVIDHIDPQPPAGYSPAAGTDSAPVSDHGLADDPIPGLREQPLNEMVLKTRQT